MKRSAKRPGKSDSTPEVPFLLPGHRIRRAFDSGIIVGTVGRATIIRETRGESISHFELAEQSAAESRKRGRPIEKHTQAWLDVPQWSDEREREEINKFLRPDEDPFAARRLGCRAYLRGSQAAASALAAMARECLGQLQKVAECIDETELYSAHASIAAEQLAGVLTEACSKMNELARRQPKIFQRFTRRGYWKWPVMKSTYPEFGDDERALLAGLQIGQGLPLRLDAKAQWARHINGDAGRFAWALLWYIWRARSENNRFGIDYGQFGQIADALPPLNKQSALEWWEAARKALLYSYPKLLEVPELAALVSGRKQRRYPSRLEEAILSKLKMRFLSFARVAKTSPA